MKENETPLTERMFLFILFMHHAVTTTKVLQAGSVCSERDQNVCLSEREIMDMMRS